MTVQVASMGLTVKVSALNVNGNGIHIYKSGICIACSFPGGPIYMQCIQLCTYNTIIIIHLTIAACARMCQNGGTRSELTCTCDCADGYSGDTCGSELKSLTLTAMYLYIQLCFHICTSECASACLKATYHK